MKAGQNTGIKYAVVMTLFLAALLFFYYFQYEKTRTLRTALERTEGDPLSFSADSGFYEDPFVLQLKTDDAIPQEDSIEIRYTLNGDEPTADSALYDPGQGIDLESAIRRIEAEKSEEAKATQAGDAEEDTTLEGQYRQWKQEKDALASGEGTLVEAADDGIRVVPVRARLVQGEDMGAVVTRTYVIGPGVSDRYDAYVVCISTDSANLFDYDHGIMVKGSNYQKDIDEGKRVDRSGNFYHEGEDWVKDGHVTLFSPEGEVLLEEDAGISVGGFSSRILPTRSLCAEASTWRGSSGDSFQLDMFKGSAYSRAGNVEKLTDASSEREPDSFRKLRFRTHGVPYYRIRSARGEYAKILSDGCGFPGLPEARLGVTYLNGEFYTACDITPSVTKEYMCSLFGLKTPDAIERYDASDYEAYKTAKILPLFEADLTMTQNQKALEQAVDMDNYLFYFALETLFNNSDWPFNNVTMWRYLGETDPENPYTDGRYRFLLDDMDQILTNGLHSKPEHWSTEVVDYLMKDEDNTFHHVMQCKKYRDTFLTFVDDLLRTSFEPEYACKILDAVYDDMKREYITDYGPAFWEEMEDTISATKNNVVEKEALYRADVAKYMGLEERYEVTIEAGEGVSLTWNNMTLSPGETWFNEYYRGTAFTVTAHPAEGCSFAGWEINGKWVDANGSSTLEISDAFAFEETDPSAPVHITVRAAAESKQKTP